MFDIVRLSFNKAAKKRFHRWFKKSKIHLYRKEWFHLLFGNEILLNYLTGNND